MLIGKAGGTDFHMFGLRFPSVFDMDTGYMIPVTGSVDHS